jgi:hypothetical protein
VLLGLTVGRNAVGDRKPRSLPDRGVGTGQGGVGSRGVGEHRDRDGVLTLEVHDADLVAQCAETSGLARHPGSTFKVVTVTAALRAGLTTLDTPLPCPGTENVQGRQIPNDNGFDLRTVPLHTAFAHSCNTTFARLGVGLDRTAFSGTRPEPPRPNRRRFPRTCAPSSQP